MYTCPGHDVKLFWCMTRLPKDFFVHQVIEPNFFCVFFSFNKQYKKTQGSLRLFREASGHSGKIF